MKKKIQKKRSKVNLRRGGAMLEAVSTPRPLRELAEAAALRLAALGSDPWEVAEALGVRIYKGALSSLNGACLSSEANAILISSRLTPAEQMATLAHELMHHAGVRDSDMPGSVTIADIEYACDQGAMLLLATQLLARRVRP